MEFQNQQNYVIEDFYVLHLIALTCLIFHVFHFGGYDDVFNFFRGFILLGQIVRRIFHQAVLTQW
jgi:hypothetical protein